ncbi:MAG: CRISPR-associated endonuclease Cas1 [Candidatus Fischerbacteria bacterium RBG_13_37_8]|uniref:CRISPR-associated endonuclease Cas1 n=1 Tax=Candidatus Fischerbacteria bacterium RBG_13_37_8 TaxID=1817863 RepID=A0A1F5VXV9_9BACT|nr:MAG: CRISPR-associated endonuclease Cas1 [Candidatus Fischerbacteria bacterium RBG_13_37_8]
MDKKQLIVDTYGVFVSKHSERVRVKSEGKIIEEIPLIHLESILITSRGVSISSDVVEICADRGIDIVFLSGTGEVYGRLGSPMLIGTVKTRREQLMALTDKRGLVLGKAFASGKINNQRNLLKYFSRYRKTTNKDLYEVMENTCKKLESHDKELAILDADTIDQVRENLLNIEGRAASLYWQTIKEMLGDEIGWKGRETRGAQDPINSALNYGYGILYGQIEKSVILAGLDPYAGFVHTDKAGKPSLVLDLIEEFRQQIVDKAVFAILGKGTEIAVNSEGMLEDKSRKAIAQKVLERLDNDERFEGMKQKIRTIMMKQAQSVASFVRGDRQTYKPFIGSW